MTLISAVTTPRSEHSLVSDKPCLPVWKNAVRQSAAPWRIVSPCTSRPGFVRSRSKFRPHSRLDQRLHRKPISLRRSSLFDSPFLKGPQAGGCFSNSHSTLRYGKDVDHHFFPTTQSRPGSVRLPVCRIRTVPATPLWCGARRQATPTGQACLPARSRLQYAPMPGFWFRAATGRPERASRPGASHGAVYLSLLQSRPKRIGTHPPSQTTQQLSPGLLPAAPMRDG